MNPEIWQIVLPVIPIVVFQVGYYGFIQIKERQFKLTETAMAVAEAVIWIFQINMLLQLARLEDPLYPLFFYLNTFGFYIYFGIAIAGTLFLVVFKKMPEADQFTQRCKEKVRNRGYNLKRDFGRKFAHLMFFVCMFIAFQIMVLAMSEMNILPATDEEMRSFVWGIRPEIVLWPWNWIGNVGIFHIVMFYCFMVTHQVLFGIEVCRRSDRWWGPLKNAAIVLLKPKELENMASFSPFMTGILLAATFLPPFPLFALIYIMVVSDTAASQIGMRFGKNKLPWHRTKSLQGSIAGLVASLGCIVFVGPIWGIVGAFVFLISDFLTEKPIPMPDNFMVPLLGVGFFLYLVFLGIPYSPMPFFI